MGIAAWTLTSAVEPSAMKLASVIEPSGCTAAPSCKAASNWHLSFAGCCDHYRYRDQPPTHFSMRQDRMAYLGKSIHASSSSSSWSTSNPEAPFSPTTEYIISFGWFGGIAICNPVAEEEAMGDIVAPVGLSSVCANA